MKTIDPFSNRPGFSLLGWPNETPCPNCGARSAHLSSTIQSAGYECRGTPVEKGSAYGPDRCGLVFEVKRED